MKVILKNQYNKIQLKNPKIESIQIINQFFYNR